MYVVCVYGSTLLGSVVIMHWYRIRRPLAILIIYRLRTASDIEKKQILDCMYVKTIIRKLTDLFEKNPASSFLLTAEGCT